MTGRDSGWRPNVYPKDTEREDRIHNEAIVDLSNFVPSNCAWKQGDMTAGYRRPFDILADAVVADRRVRIGATPEVAPNGNWLPRKCGFQPPLRR